MPTYANTDTNFMCTKITLYKYIWCLRKSHIYHFAIMSITTLLLLTLSFLGLTMGQDCFVPGGCVNSSLVGFSQTSDSRGCLEDCQVKDGCNWFTYREQLNLCELFNDCNSLDQDCTECVSGEVSCPAYQCDIEGTCYVNIFWNLEKAKVNYLIFFPGKFANYWSCRFQRFLPDELQIIY
jgi:hypothetical protein